MNKLFEIVVFNTAVPQVKELRDANLSDISSVFVPYYKGQLTPIECSLDDGTNQRVDQGGEGDRLPAEFLGDHGEQLQQQREGAHVGRGALQMRREHGDDVRDGALPVVRSRVDDESRHGNADPSEHDLGPVVLGHGVKQLLPEPVILVNWQLGPAPGHLDQSQLSINSDQPIRDQLT